MALTNLWDKVEPLLLGVERPSRYINHEYNSVEVADGLVRAALLYPDTYELGQSNLAIGILYALVNAQPDCVAHRVFLPWTDLAEAMREERIPLFTLEACAPVKEFDLLGITLPHELAATNVLEALDLARIALRACDRGEDDPLVVGGGPVAYNPEPLAPFFDAFVIGEGEEVMLELLAVLREGKQRGAGRREMLEELAGLVGVYVPGLVPKDGSGGFAACVTKRVVRDFAALPPVIEAVVPFAEVTHDRLAVEVLRGCSRGCRFCQAGMIYRPVRERSADMVIDAVAQGLGCTGFNEVSLLSLSTTDHSQIKEILRRLNHMTAGTGVSLSIPSQRVDGFGVAMAQLVSGERKAGLTFAPEAGTQRLRDSINKNVHEADLLEAVEAAFAQGWRRCKLYFMLGLPGERDEDIAGIADLANRAFAVAKDAVDMQSRGQVRMTVSVAVFIPKPHTPFQWSGQIDLAEIERRIALLRSCEMDRGIDLSWHDPATAVIEAALARAGQEAANLIEQAWLAGARFDAWSDQFDAEHWRQAELMSGVDIGALAERSLDVDDRLPWDHIDTGVSKAFLWQEYTKALEGITSEDCSFEACLRCGVCTELRAKVQLGGKSRG